jgi:peptide-methionine (S)-S-oxide reductase
MSRFQHGRLATRTFLLAATCACLIAVAASVRYAASQEKPGREAAGVSTSEKLEVATFGAGCFWCTEAVFERVKGVEKVVSGYSGGTVENPTYQQVCSGQTGHAEVVQLTFDPAKISYADLLEIFWKTHDPTTPNQQGPDVGTQYRSAVFYHSDEQQKVAEAYKQQLNESKAFDKPIVTEITKFTNFYAAEKYHQDYFELNRRQPYCSRYISPKIKKFNRMFRDKLKDKEEE